MSFPINTNIPAAGNNPSNDQPLMQQNFLNINGFLGVDLTGPGTGSAGQAGQHNQVRFSLNQAAPSLANAVCELFANVGPSLSELWFANGTKTWQMTDLQFVTGVNGGSAGGSLNYFDTPWNIRFYYGFTNPFLGAGTVNFPSSYSTLIVSLAVPDDPSVQAFSCQGFPGSLTLHTQNSTQLRWLALGRI
jgi:hypothetical protein